MALESKHVKAQTYLKDYGPKDPHFTVKEMQAYLVPGKQGSNGGCNYKAY